jgi:hypothetical protein
MFLEFNLEQALRYSNISYPSLLEHKPLGAETGFSLCAIRLQKDPDSLAPLVFPVLRILQKLWGGPPVRAGPPGPALRQQDRSHPNVQAGQGAGRGPGHKR